MRQLTMRQLTAQLSSPRRALTLTFMGLTLSLTPVSETSAKPTKALTIDLEANKAEGGSSTGARSEGPRYERPFIWEVTCPKRAPMYLVGTMHVPDARFHRLHPKLLEVIEKSERVYGELDLSDKMKLSAAITPHLMLPAGQQLQQRLPPKVYELLKRYLERKGSNVMLFSMMKPSAVEIMLPMLDLMPLMAQGLPVLDEVILKRAKELGKEVGGVETIDEQLKAMFSSTEEEVVESLGHTLKRLHEALDKGEDPQKKLFDAFFSGEGERVQAEIDAELKGAPRSQVKLMDKLLRQRNIKMTERILSITQERSTQRHLFAFGLAHFLGKDSVTRGLRAEGCLTHQAGGASTKGEPSIKKTPSKTADEPSAPKVRKPALIKTR